MGACSGRETALLLIRSVNLYRYDCYIALFSALEQNHCSLACNSKWVTSFFIVRFEFPPMWCTYRTVWLLTWLVTRDTAAVSVRSVYTCYTVPCTICHVTSLKATYLGCMPRVYMQTATCSFGKMTGIFYVLQR